MGCAQVLNINTFFNSVTLLRIQKTKNARMLSFYQDELWDVCKWSTISTTRLKHIIILQPRRQKNIKCSDRDPLLGRNIEFPETCQKGHTIII